jgi:hypothetical protein
MYSTSLTAIFVFLYRKVNKTYDVAVMVSIDQPAPRKNDSDALGCLKRTRGHGPAPDRPRRQYRGPRFDLLLEALSCTVVTVSLDFTPWLPYWTSHSALPSSHFFSLHLYIQSRHTLSLQHHRMDGTAPCRLQLAKGHGPAPDWTAAQISRLRILTERRHWTGPPLQGTRSQSGCSAPGLNDITQPAHPSLTLGPYIPLDNWFSKLRFIQLTNATARNRLAYPCFFVISLIWNWHCNVLLGDQFLIKRLTDVLRY